ncbi:hypothetical protein SDC9_135004 [bioreactor metagenome]|uniref:Uncharacterized protein n=1 Tax=bioreactor metagenome TaxID=1076179 RepID=A0A645DGF5_9ZZZZ
MSFDIGLPEVIEAVRQPCVYRDAVCQRQHQSGCNRVTDVMHAAQTRQDKDGLRCSQQAGARTCGRDAPLGERRDCQVHLVVFSAKDPDVTWLDCPKSFGRLVFHPHPGAKQLRYGLAQCQVVRAVLAALKVPVQKRRLVGEVLAVGLQLNVLRCQVRQEGAAEHCIRERDQRRGRPSRCGQGGTNSAAPARNRSDDSRDKAGIGSAKTIYRLLGVANPD